MSRIASTVLTLTLVLAAVAASPAQELHVGTAAIDITPPVGTPMQAPQRPPFEVKLAEPAHDPLFAKALVLADGEQKAAIVVCDLTSIPVALIEESRRRIAATTDLDPSAVMIGATHTHTAPQIRPRFVARADDAARAKTAAYVAALPEQIALAVKTANERLAPAAAAAAVGRETTISFNRRYVMRDGSVRTNPGKDDPALQQQIVRPAGPIDPDIGVVVFQQPAGARVATLVNFAIHLDTVGGYRPSADFPFQLAALLGQVAGPDMLTIFAPGASGNINHYDLLHPGGARREKNLAECTRLGVILAGEVLRSFPRLEPVQIGPLRTERRVVRLAMPEEKGRALAARFGNEKKFFDGEVTVYNEADRQQFDAEVQVIALGGELAWVGFPGEMFVEHGLALKQASPFRFTLVHTLANGSIGYVPDRKAYGHGAYEDTVTRCAPGAGEQLVDVATALLTSLHRSTTP